MKKLSVFIPFFLFASVYPDFRPCYLKYSYIKNSVPVTKTRSVTFNKQNCLNYDPFTGMCVIKAKNKKTVKFFHNPKLGWWIAGIRKNEIYVGNYAKKGVFFLPSRMSVKPPKNSVVADMFCRAVGIGNSEGFIDGGMVKHFVRYGYWGDIGIEIDENMKIISFDPFYVKGLKTGDKVQKINAKKASAGIFRRYVLENVCGKKVTLKINGKNYVLKIRKKQYLYTPLEKYGIKVNKDLTLKSLPEKLKKTYFIKEGAKITAVNKIKIKTFEDLKKALSTYKNVTITLLQEGIESTIPLR
jgi:hypothetical protein